MEMFIPTLQSHFYCYADAFVRLDNLCKIDAIVHTELEKCRETWKTAAELGKKIIESFPSQGSFVSLSYALSH